MIFWEVVDIWNRSTTLFWILSERLGEESSEHCQAKWTPEARRFCKNSLSQIRTVDDSLSKQDLKDLIAVSCLYFNFKSWIGKYVQSFNCTGSTWYFPLTVHHGSRSHQGLPISSRPAAVCGTNVGTPGSASGAEMATTREAMESQRQRLGRDFNQMWSGFGAKEGCIMVITY